MPVLYNTNLNHKKVNHDNFLLASTLLFSFSLLMKFHVFLKIRNVIAKKKRKKKLGTVIYVCLIASDSWRPSHVLMFMFNSGVKTTA